MVHQSGGHIRRDTHIEAGPRIERLEDVDEASAPTHGDPQGKSGASVVGAETLEFLSGSSRRCAVLADNSNGEVCEYGAASSARLAARLPPSRLRRYGATSFAWLAEPKLTLRRKLA
jgi:hypothetical protein